MATAVLMPRIDEDMTEGTLVEWKKKPGSTIRNGDILCVVESEKVTWEIEAESSGLMGEPLVREGDTAAVGTILAYILAPGEESPSGEQRTSIRERGTEPHRVDNEDFKPIEQTKESRRIKASPRARKIALEHGIDLSTVAGSGEGGRIAHEDVGRAIEKKTGGGTESASPEQEVVDMSPMRAAIARRMTESFSSIPHFYLSVTIDAGEMIKLKDSLRDDYKTKTSVRPTITDLLIAASARALIDNPGINVRWVDGNIVRMKVVNIGLAVSTPGGLIVPVLTDAGSMSIIDICCKRNDLVERARRNRIKPMEMKDGSITLTNIGMFGIDQAMSIINPPQSAIIAVGRITDKPAVFRGKMCIRPLMNVTLSIDHRTIDGAEAARFLQSLKNYIEDPELYPVLLNK
jgi:pyruvate dehydrogenase E2 component (dihydrolipoamide acetyltransferase)